MTLTRLTLSISRLARAALALAVTALPLIASADATGYVVAWGDNYGDAINVPPIALSDVKEITAGYFHTVALKSDGTVIAWGDNGWGQCNVPAGLVATAVDGGYGHTLAVRTDGTVAAWGDNSLGACNVPAGLSGVVAVSSGGQDLCMALKNDGTVVFWGNYAHHIVVPPSLSGVVEIGCSSGYGLALKSDGTVLLLYWGSPQLLSGFTGITHIAAGEAHALGLKGDGTVVAWGQNDFGQCDIPIGLSNVAKIAVGGYHSLALKSDGTVVGWGHNSSGQTSIPSATNGAIGIAGGAGFSVALMPTKPFPATLSVTNPTITAGRPGPATCTVTLPAAATSDTVFPLTASNPAVSIPASVTIPNGQTSVTFPIWSDRVLTITPVTISASFPLCEDGKLELTLNPFAIDRIRFTGLTGGQFEWGKSFTATVYLDAPTRDALVVDISTDEPTVVPESAQVTIPAGSIKGTVTINSLSVSPVAQDVTITATLGGSTLTSLISAMAPPTIISVTPDKPTFYANGTGTFTITLSRPASPGGSFVTVSYLFGGGGLDGERFFMIPQGKSTYKFSVKVDDFSAPIARTINFANYMSAVSATVNVEPIAVKSVVLNPRYVAGGGSTTATVTLTHRVERATYVEMFSDSGYAQVPAFILIPAGSLKGTASVVATAVPKQKSVRISASRNGVAPKEAILRITP